MLKWLLSIDKFDNNIMNLDLEITKESAKLIFDNGYTPTSKLLKEQYTEYKKERTDELKSVIMNEYMIADLWNLVLM
jgi:hypothetical protein